MVTTLIFKGSQTYPNSVIHDQSDRTKISFSRAPLKTSLGIMLLPNLSKPLSLGSLKLTHTLHMKNLKKNKCNQTQEIHLHETGEKIIQGMTQKCGPF